MLQNFYGGRGEWYLFTNIGINSTRELLKYNISHVTNLAMETTSNPASPVKMHVMLYRSIII